MNTALTYILNGWDDLLNYRNDGRYTIDNMLAFYQALLSIRRISLHFSSEEGVTVAMTYLTIMKQQRCIDLRFMIIWRMFFER